MVGSTGLVYVAFSFFPDSVITYDNLITNINKYYPGKLIVVLSNRMFYCQVSKYIDKMS